MGQRVSVTAMSKRARQRTTITRTTPIAELPQFLSVEEFAGYLGVGRTLAYEMVRCDPRVRAVRVGRLFRVPRDAIVSLAK